MVDVDTGRPGRPERPDRTTRTAALWATAVAVPVALLVGALIVGQLIPGATRNARPEATATSPAAVPAAPVPVAAPKLSPRAAQVCLAVTSQLPSAIRSLPARRVTAGPEQNAAYGEPPITVQCGVPQPAMCPTAAGGSGCVPLDTELLIMNDVCWYPVPGTQANVFTTMDREIPVQVSVPASYQQPAQWANEFSDTLVETDPSRTSGVPSGCRS
jgi:Protein of unknown function (DUF3515)